MTAVNLLIILVLTDKAQRGKTNVERQTNEQKPELFMLKDMAEYFNVTKQYINKLKNEDPNFPKPTFEKGRVYLYTKEQVEKYGQLRNFGKPHANRLERIKKEGE